MRHTPIGRLSFGHFKTLFFALASVFLLPEGCRGQEKPPSNSPEKQSGITDTLDKKEQPASLLSPELIPDSVQRRMLPAGHFKVDITEVRQRDVSDHYINIVKGKTTNVEIFDGKNSQNLVFSEGEIVAASLDERYFSVAKLGRKNGAGYAVEYEVELRDIYNKTVAQKRLEALGSDESEDEIFPLNKGEGIVQKAFFINNNLYFKVFSCQNSTFREQFTFDKSEAWNSRFAISDDNTSIVVGYTEEDSISHAEKTYVESLDLNGTGQWKKTIAGMVMQSKIYISPFDGTVVFTCDKTDYFENKYLHIIDRRGLLKKVFTVYKGGLYQSSFQMVNRKQYLLAPSDGAYFYVIDLDKLEIVNKNTMVHPEYCITSIKFHNDLIVSSYFISRRSEQNKHYIRVVETGVVIEDQNGKFLIKPLKMKGYLELAKSNQSLFAIDQPFSIGDHTFHQYKINIQ